MLTPEAARFVLDRDRLTCGGGIAAMDMMHALIAQRHGAAFARQVTDWFLHRQVDEPQAPQRASTAQRYQVHQPAVVAALEKMQLSLSEPITRVLMASQLGLSTRQLDRLFSTHLKATYHQHYLSMRLAHARVLLQQSALSVMQVAVACGFNSATHFSRCFRERFGQTPRQVRGPTHATRVAPGQSRLGPN